MKIYKFSIALVFICVAGMACSKKDDVSCSSPLPTKQTVIISSTGNLDIKYHFRSDGKIDSIESLGVNKFSYGAGTVTNTLTKFVVDGYARTTSVYNNQGAVIKETYQLQQTRNGNETTTYSTTTTYEYDSQRLIKAITTYSDMSPIKITTYQWQNGNMIFKSTKQGDKSYTRTYTYYEDKPFQTGDEFFMSDIGSYGHAAFTIKNKNLMKTRDGVVLDYTFDNKGRIIGRTVRGENNTALFDYTCN